MDSEQIKSERSALYAKFALDEHKIREGYTRGGKITWFVYVDSEAIQARLDELFFMEWELTYSDYPTLQDDFVSVAATLKIRGMARTGSGGQGLNGQTKVNEDTVKGAYTDAFKRAAAKWGIAMYLTIAPKFTTDTYTKGAWDMRDFREEEAWSQFVAWYEQKPYVAPVKPGQQKPAAAPKVATSQPPPQPTVYKAPPAAADDGNMFACASAYYQKTSQGGYVVFRADHDTNLTATMYGGREKLIELMGKQWADANGVPNWANGTHALILPVYVKWAQDDKGNRKVEELKAS